MAELNDLLGAVINKSPVDFSTALHDIMNTKAMESVSSFKTEIAQGLFGETAPDVDDVNIGIDDINLDAALEDLVDGQDA